MDNSRQPVQKKKCRRPPGLIFFPTRVVKVESPRRPEVGRARKMSSEMNEYVCKMIRKIPAKKEEFSILYKESEKYSTMVQAIAVSIKSSLKEAHLLHAFGLNSQRYVLDECKKSKIVSEEDMLYLEKLLQLAFSILGLRENINQNMNAMWNQMLN